LYVSATHPVVSRALVIEKETSQMGNFVKQQYEVYFILEGLGRIKEVLFQGGEDLLCSHHEREEAPTLF
jgi:hypothetical protein